MVAETSWVDTAVVIIVIGVGLTILYSALKEPLDLLFGAIFRGLVAIKDKVVGLGDSDGGGYSEISYG